MKLLLDSHALYWWVENDARLSARAREAIRDPKNSIVVSAASAWELAIKVKKGVFPEAAALVARFEDTVVAEGFRHLDITPAHALYAGGLERHHDDPFDRVLVAQALIELLPLVSGDKALDPYGVTRLW